VVILQRRFTDGRLRARAGEGPDFSFHMYDARYLDKPVILRVYHNNEDRVPVAIQAAWAAAGLAPHVLLSKRIMRTVGDIVVDTEIHLVSRAVADDISSRATMRPSLTIS